MAAENGKVITFTGAHAYLSNFFRASFQYRSPFTNDLFWFPSVEHAYQAHKATNIDNFKHVQQARTAAQAKQRGREIQKRPDWEEIKAYVMFELVRAKFSVHTDLKYRCNFWGRHASRFLP